MVKESQNQQSSYFAKSDLEKGLSESVLDFNSGLNPKGKLQKIELTIKEQASKYNDDVHFPRDLSKIAKTYADCEMFEEAMTLTDEIKSYNISQTSYIKSETLEHIARKQLEKELTSNVIETAKKGLELPEGLTEKDHDRWFLSSVSAAKFHCLIAQAESKEGKDPSRSLEKALEKTQKITTQGDWWKADIRLIVAKAKASINIDPRQDLYQALLDIDGISEKVDFNEWDEVSQMQGWEDIIKAQTELGLTDDALSTLKRIEEWNTDYSEDKREIIKECRNFIDATA